MKKSLFSAMLFSVMIPVQSCNKEPEVPIPQEHGAHITLMNVCNGTGEINATVKNRGNTLFRRLNFLSISGYYVLPADDYNITFTTVPTSQLLCSDQSRLEYEKYYLAMVVGKVGKARVVVTENNTEIPQAGKAHIRFINVSPDSFKVNITGNAAALFTGINYKEATAYMEVNAGAFNFTAGKNSESESLTQNNFTLEAQKNYTLLLTGAKNGESEEALNLKLIRY